MHTQTHFGAVDPLPAPHVPGRSGSSRASTKVATRGNDEALLRRARAGDMRALEELLDRYHPHIERICRRMCRGDDSFDDVLQETYLGIVRSIRSFRGDSAFLTWVYTIARTFRGRHVRKTARHQHRLDALEHSLPAIHLDFERLAVGHHLGAAIDQALGSLSDLDRTILLLRDADGLTATEVASQTGLTIPAVKTRLHRARVAVRRQLDAVRADLGYVRGGVHASPRPSQ